MRASLQHYDMMLTWLMCYFTEIAELHLKLDVYTASPEAQTSCVLQEEFLPRYALGTFSPSLG